MARALRWPEAAVEPEEDQAQEALEELEEIQAMGVLEEGLEIQAEVVRV